MGNTNSTTDALADVRVCYFCGEHIPKTKLGQHNKDVHSVLRFNWMNGESLPEIVSTRNIQISIGKIIPPMPNSPPPIIPKPPSESPSSQKTTKRGRLFNGNKDSSDDRSVDTTVYDMDISADSDTDSDKFIEGKLFEKSSVESTPRANEKTTETNGLVNVVPQRRVKKSRFSDAVPIPAGKIQLIQKIAPIHKKIEDIPKSCVKADELKEGKKETTKKLSRTKSILKRPKLTAEVNDNFFELILTTKVYSDSDAEYGEFPVRSKLKPNDKEVIDCPEKRQRTTSTSSTTSSNGKTQQQRVTNADLKKIIKQNLKQGSPKQG